MITPRIRAATPTDFPALVEIQNASSPNYPTTLPQKKYREEGRKPDLIFGRLVAEVAGRVVGVTGHTQQEWSGEVGKLWVWLTVHPAYRGQGIGRALYNAAQVEIQMHHPKKLVTQVREDRPDALHFASSRGFVQVAREQDADLELARLDVTQRTKSFAVVQAGGYELNTLADLISEKGTDRAWEQYYALDSDATRDVPLAPGDTLEMPTLTRYREHVENNPNFDPSLCFLASKDEKLAALSELRTSPEPGRLETGFTGVARAHRGHRLAWALKYLALEEAIRRGATHVRTSNDETNLPMRNINTGLGFVPIPASLIMSLTLE